MILENDRLKVQFAEAETLQTQRFDHTAMISQILLDGKHSFCTPEQLIPERRTCHGMGLCGEFVLLGAAEEAMAGQWFCKPGVGLLRQLEDGMPYDMWKRYEVQPFPVTMEKEAGRVVCRQQPVPQGGYAVELEKVFTLEGNRLILDTRATNTGEKKIWLQEYQHNFVSLDGIRVGDGYALELSCDKQLKQIESQTMRREDESPLPAAVRADGNGMYWEKDMEEKVIYHRSEDIDPEVPSRWTLRHSGTPVRMSEETVFTPSRIDIWAIEHCICAEFYHSAHIAPGETAHWRRIWTFDAG